MNDVFRNLLIRVLLTALLSTVASANLRPPGYDVSQDTITPVTEYSTTAISGWYTDCWASSITTVNGSTYFVYVDPDAHIKVGKMTNGSVTVHDVESGYTIINSSDGHYECCVAVDKWGTIHVLGGMHCDTLQYWRSNAAYSITNGFTRHFDAIDGTFSYYAFRKDHNNELYLVCRCGVKDNWWEPGGRGVGLYRYYVGSRTWYAKGAVPPGGAHKAVLWEDSGQNGGGYQMLKADVRFDYNNRLHLTSTIIKDGAGSNNYAVYAYSDDGGESFKKADGTVLTLPMTIDAGSSQANVIDGYYSAGMGEHAGLFLDDQNRPGVYYSIDGKTWYRYWNGSSWQPRAQLNGSQWSRAFALSDAWGTHTLVNGSTWKRFEDFGVEPVSFNTGRNVSRWDLEALRDDDTYRGIEWSSSTGSWKIVRFDITNPTAISAAFQQDSGYDGVVSMESENFDLAASPASHDWNRITTPGGCSGGAAMRAEPDIGTNVNTGYADNSPRLDFNVNFVKTGTHYVWIRGYRAGGDDDSCHVGIDGQEIATADRVSNFPSYSSWCWTGTTMDAGARARINVTSPGSHTINVWMREDGFRCDKIVLTTNAGYTPSGAGPAESPHN